MYGFEGREWGVLELVVICLDVKLLFVKLGRLKYFCVGYFWW